MRVLDPMLDDLAYIAKLYADGAPQRDGTPIAMPPRPKLAWTFNDTEFGILDEATGVFFLISPYFAR